MELASVGARMGGAARYAAASSRSVVEACRMSARAARMRGSGSYCLLGLGLASTGSTWSLVTVAVEAFSDGIEFGLL